MRLTTFLKPLSFLPALLLMYMIYSFSAQDAQLSTSISYKASQMLVKSADYVFDLHLDEYQVADYAVRIHGVTRKLAHMTEYFLLAVAVSFPLYVYGLRGILLLIVAGVVCIGFACTDEYHQSFVAGRGPSRKDVMIDSVGVIAGILLVRIVGWTGRHTLFRSSLKHSEQKRADRQIQKLQKRQRRLERQQALNEERYYEQLRRQAQAYGRDPGAYPQGGSPDGRHGAAAGYAGDGTAPYNTSYNGSTDGGPFPSQEPPEPSSDELAEDMPLSRLFRPDQKAEAKRR